VRNGEPELGVTMHRMDEQFDTGGVLAQGSMALGDDDWMADLQPRFAELMPALLSRVFERVADGDPGDPQDDAEASYAGFFEDEYGDLDWSWPADEVHRRVRAWSFQIGRGRGARAPLDGAERRLLATRVERGETRGRPGDVLDRDGEALLVRCGEDAVWVLESGPAPP
jgi:methionyl-tRNA formyltransferase